MAIEFLRMKLRRASGAVTLLSGGATLHPDGMIDAHGDAAEHADHIVSILESVDPHKTSDLLPHDRVLADDCEGCPLLARVGASCACLQVDRFRVGDAESLTPMQLRPGRPPAELRGVERDRPPSLWPDFVRFRMARARGAAATLLRESACAA